MWIILIIVISLFIFICGIPVGSWIEYNSTYINKIFIDWTAVSAVGTVIGALGAIAIPIALQDQAKKERDRKDKEEQERIKLINMKELKEKEQQFLDSHIREHLFPLLNEYLKINQLKYMEGKEKGLEAFKFLEDYDRKIFIAITSFQYVIREIEYKYMNIGLECIVLLLKELQIQYEKYQKSSIVNKLSIDELNAINLPAMLVYELISNYITYLPNYLLISQEKYEKSIKEYFTKQSEHKHIKKLVTAIIQDAYLELNRKKYGESYNARIEITFSKPELVQLYENIELGLKYKEQINK